MRLTAKKVASLKRPGRYADGGTLYFVVEPPPSTSRHWVQRLVVDGRRRDIGLGGYPFVGLADARAQAFENRRLARRGGDPLARPGRHRIPTFRAASETVGAAGGWRGSTRKNREAALVRYCGGILDKGVDRVGREDVLKILSPVYAEKPATGRRLRGWIRGVLAWAQAHGHVEVNVAGECIDAALPPAPKVKEHRAALPYREVPAALAAVAGSSSGEATKACLRFIALTAVRSGEARGATWDEVDLEAREWRIPGERMKTGQPHRVPLSAAAASVVETMKPLRSTDGPDLVFPGVGGKPLSASTLLHCLRHLGYTATVHGLRSSFRTWAAERANVTRDIAEMRLAHVVGSDIERSYQRGDLFDRRRALMEQWAAYVAGGAGTEAPR